MRKSNEWSSNNSQIKSDLGNFCRNRKTHQVVALAVRSALRVFPFIFDSGKPTLGLHPHDERKVIVAVFRSLWTNWYYLHSGPSGVSNALSSAYHSKLIAATSVFLQHHSVNN